MSYENKKVTLCADDFAFTEGISEGILSLCKLGKLDSVSVMVESPLAKHYAFRLLNYKPQIQIGLHFNLTTSFHLRCFSLLSLMLSPVWFLPSRKKEIENRLREQILLFESLFGIPPDFIDGHQHIHVFPFIRKCFLNIIQQNYKNRCRPWIRQVSQALQHTDSRVKVSVLSLLNTGFARQCEKRGFKCNENFAGVYSLKESASFESLLKQWIDDSKENTLIMLHPARPCKKGDPLEKIREKEYLVLQQL